MSQEYDPRVIHNTVYDFFPDQELGLSTQCSKNGESIILTLETLEGYRVPKVAYEVTFVDHSIRTGHLDKEGSAILNKTPMGTYFVRYPEETQVRATALAVRMHHALVNKNLETVLGILGESPVSLQDIQHYHNTLYGSSMIDRIESTFTERKEKLALGYLFALGHLENTKNHTQQTDDFTIKAVPNAVVSPGTEGVKIKYEILNKSEKYPSIETLITTWICLRQQNTEPQNLLTIEYHKWPNPIIPIAQFSLINPEEIRFKTTFTAKIKNLCPHRIICFIYIENQIYFVDYHQSVASRAQKLKQGALNRILDENDDPVSTLNILENYIEAEKKIQTLMKQDLNYVASEEYEQEFESREEYRDKLKERLASTQGKDRHYIKASYACDIKSEPQPLYAFITQLKPGHWIIVDWTQPVDRSQTGEYEGTKDWCWKTCSTIVNDDIIAIENAIDKWKSGNRYPTGAIAYEFDLPSKYGLPQTHFKGDFATDGESSWDAIIRWLGLVSLVFGVPALIRLIVCRVVMGGFFWTASTTSTAAAVINIAQRQEEGFQNGRELLYDSLTIVANLVGMGGLVRAGSTVKHAATLNGVPGFKAKALSFTEWTVDGAELILIGEGAYSDIVTTLNDTALNPGQKLDKLLGIVSSSALEGSLTAAQFKPTNLDRVVAGSSPQTLKQLSPEQVKKLLSDSDQEIQLIIHNDVEVIGNPSIQNTIVQTTDGGYPISPAPPPKSSAGNPNAMMPKPGNVVTSNLTRNLTDEAASIISSSSKGQLRQQAALSRAVIDELNIVSESFKNLPGSVKNFPGVRRLDDEFFVIDDQAAYIRQVEKLYADSGNTLNSVTRARILEHVGDGTKQLPTQAGIPGLHAEVQSVNSVINQVPADFDLSRINVSTIKLAPGPGQGLPFPACSNCGNILSNSANILTGVK